MGNDKLILVTGMPRSGTTWVGKTIAQASSVHYVHEPFNISGRRCACGVRFDKWFYYITRENEADFRGHIEHTVDSSPNSYRLRNMASEVWASRRLRPAVEFARSVRAARVVVKDPLAILSTSWLSTTFDMSVVVLVRHPAAVVSSYKKLGWPHPFSHFLQQPLLMRDYLYIFEREINEYAREEHDIVEQVSFLWKLVHYVLLEQRQYHEDWILVRHEDLSADPVSRFEMLFEQLNLPFLEQTNLSIQRNSQRADLANPADPYSISRNSKTLVRQWKSDLSPGEIERIKALVGEVAKSFYSEEDW